MEYLRFGTIKLKKINMYVHFIHVFVLALITQLQIVMNSLWKFNLPLGTNNSNSKTKISYLVIFDEAYLKTRYSNTLVACHHIHRLNQIKISFWQPLLNPHQQSSSPKNEPICIPRSTCSQISMCVSISKQICFFQH